MTEKIRLRSQATPSFERVNIWWLYHPLDSAKAFKNLSAIVLIIDRARRSNKNQRIFDSLLWQLR